MQDSPLVSIVMPVYNSAPFICSSIRSVLAQTCKNWELLIVDDASVDETVSVIEEFSSKDPRIKLFQNSINRGAGAARNIAIEEARGDFIAFLDADDLWLPEKLEVQLKFMQEKNLPMSYSSYRLISESGEILPKMIEAIPVLTYNKLLKSNYVGNLTGMYSTRALGKIYSPLLRKRQDWALWLDVLKKTGTAQGIQQPLAFYRVRKDSISNNKVGLVRYNFLIYHRFLNFGFAKSSRYMCRFLWEHFMVKNKLLKSSNF